MAQHDIEHIGDSQNSQWWGAKQGLFINALANQYGQFPIDTVFENTINQNTIFSIESTNKGACTFSNGFFNGLINDGTGISFINGEDFLPNLQRAFLSFNITVNFGLTGKQTAFGMNNETKPNKTTNCHVNFNSSVFYSQTPPIFDAFNIYKQRIKNYSTFGGFFNNGYPLPTYILPTDNLYPVGSKTMRINYIPEGGVNTFNTGVIRDLRIYTRVLTDKETTDNYHAMDATNRSNLFCEWKMAQLSDFYTYFDGISTKLYARNTGSSGNTNQDGTGYDMQLVGYNSNIPIFQSIY